MLDIAVPARVLAHIGPVPLTNGVFAAAVTSLVLIVGALILRTRMGLIPSRGQTIIELLVEYFDSQLTTAFGSRREGRKYLPLILTILLFITVANQLSLFPILFQLTFEGKSLLRLSTSDLNQTLGLALVVVGLAHVLAFLFSPLRHIGNFIKIAPLLRARSGKEVGFALLDLFTGFLDIIGELAKIMSLAARLFGNIFAGDVMIAVIVSLSAYTQYLVPMPFLVLGIFSGFVQAFVFTLLSIQFLSGTITSVKGKGDLSLAQGGGG